VGDGAAELGSGNRAGQIEKAAEDGPVTRQAKAPRLISQIVKYKHSLHC